MDFHSYTLIDIYYQLDILTLDMVGDYFHFVNINNTQSFYSWSQL